MSFQVSLPFNQHVRRFQRINAQGALASYQHGVRIGVVVDIDGDTEMGRDIAMHVAASNPVCVDESGVPADLLAKERDIVETQAKESGKPDNPISQAYLENGIAVTLNDSMQDILPQVASSSWPIPVVDDQNVYKGVVSKNRFLRTLHRTEESMETHTAS